MCIWVYDMHEYDMHEYDMHEYDMHEYECISTFTNVYLSMCRLHLINILHVHASQFCHI